jgi:hypothetical protein
LVGAAEPPGCGDIRYRSREGGDIRYRSRDGGDIRYRSRDGGDIRNRHELDGIRD